MPTDLPLTSQAPAPVLRDAGTAAAIRAVLIDAGFTEAGWRRGLAADGVALEGDDGRRAALMRRTSGGTPLEVLIRLFVLRAAARADEVARAVSPTGLETWVSCGILAVQGDRVTSAISLRPRGQLWIAADLPPSPGHPASPDHVPMVSMASEMVASLTVREPVGRTLDLCTGGGILALLAAEHSDVVLATDVNDRALAFADFNARLNNIGNIEFRHGDLFQPVEGTTFDLVVSNPPFIPSPGGSILFAHSPMRGDDLSREVVRGAAQRLNSGGVAHVVTTWVGLRDQPAEKRVQSWVADLGCDVWVCEHSRFDPETAANRWLPLTETGVDAKERAEWLAYYAELGVESVVLGVVTVRRREGGPPPWTRYESIKPVGDCGDQVLRGFANLDWLSAQVSPADLLGARLRLDPAASLTLAYGVGRDGWVPGTGVLAVPGGLGRQIEVDGIGAQVLGLLDGTRTVGEAFVAAGVDPGNYLAAVRTLVEQGFVTPQ